MGVGLGNVSLKAVRQDVDLSAAGGMRERAMQNKYGQESGNVSLAGYKGNMNCIQFAPLAGNQFQQTWPPVGRYNGAGASYIQASGTVTKSGKAVRCSAAGKGLGGGDCGMEYRFISRVTENGIYRFTVTSKINKSITSDRYNQIHINVIANPNGYLVGLNDVVVQYEQRATNHGFVYPNWSPVTQSWDFPLSTSKPYITVIFRNIQLDGGYFDSSNFDFYDAKLERVS